MQATPLIFDLFAPSYYVDDEKESNYMHFKLKFNDKYTLKK